MGAITSRSWFCVFNNPEYIIKYKLDKDGDYIYDNHGKRLEESREQNEDFFGLSPEQLCDKINDLWCDGSDTRSAACSFCVSAAGLRHLHFVVCDIKPFAFATVKKVFPRAHIEETKGSKTQAENYILKKGAFAEKGEEIISVKFRGEIRSNQGHRSDLDEIQRLIDDGYRPDEIISRGINLLSKERLIKSAYYLKRAKETPIFREVKVYYHYGLSGSGKSYYFTKLCADLGEHEVYFVGNYDNGFLDEYSGQKVLFLDEFRGQLRFATLLSICQGYRQYYHARNKNVLGLWSEVHITSVIPPEQLYKKLLDGDNHDVIDQFMRRMTGLYYHWKDKKTGEFCFRYIPHDKYNGWQCVVSGVDSDDDFQPFSQNTLPLGW